MRPRSRRALLNAKSSRRLFAATVVALVAGAAIGATFGVKTDPLGDVSKLVIQALKAIAVPLLFVAIVDALATSQFSGKGVRRLVTVAVINATIAITFGLMIVNLARPGDYLGFIKGAAAAGAPMPTATVDWHKALLSLVPESLVEPFVSGSTPAVILIAIAFGLALRHLSVSGSKEVISGATQIAKAVHIMFQLLITVIGWVVYAMPVAVFCAVAKAVGKSGLEVASGLGIFMLATLGGMALQIGITYQAWVLLHPKVTLKNFWRAARDPVTYAFGINSSLATLPMTLAALDELKVKKESARLSACVGTNFNNDGILLYEVVAALILAQVFGQEMTLSHQLYVALISIAATLGVAGFPEAGVVALTLVLSAIGLPPETIVLLLSVDWVIARSRSATNVLGDMAVAVAIDR